MGIIRVNAKCSDLCDIKFVDNSGKVLAERDGYVPTGINLGGEYDDGDYIEIDIDSRTGQIMNWKPLKDADVIKAIKK